MAAISMGGVSPRSRGDRGMVWLSCPSGIAGNLLLAALLRLAGNAAAVGRVPADLGFASQLHLRRVSHRSFPAWDLSITGIDRSRSADLAGLRALVRDSGLAPEVVDTSLQVLAARELARAAARGMEPGELTYVGDDVEDTLVDIVGSVLAWHLLGRPELRVWGPIVVGAGALAEASALLQGFPTVTGPTELELATPTGAALLSVLALPGSPSTPPRPAEVVVAGTFARRNDLAPLVAWRS